MTPDEEKLVAKLASEMVETAELLVIHLDGHANVLRAQAAKLERLSSVFADRIPTLQAIIGEEPPPPEEPPTKPRRTSKPKTTAGEALEKYKAKERARKQKAIERGT